MPKSKEFLSSDSGDSGSGSDEPKPKKKKASKPEKKEEKKSSSSSSENPKSSGTKGPNGETMFELGKMRYATISEFKGKALVSIREYYYAENGMRPGKKGISLSVEQWNALKDVLPEVDQALGRL